MKTLLRIIGIVAACIVLLLGAARVNGFEPRACPNPSVSRICGVPGLWLRGNVVTTPVADWSFTDQYPNAKVQTRDRFGIAYSVATYCVSYNGQLYLTSVYQPGTPPYPRGRHWNENIARDPHVRIKIGDNLYDRTLVYVTDPAERAAVIQNKAKKYPKQIIPRGAYINIFHAVPNDQPVSN